MLAVVPEINWFAVVVSTLVFAVLGGVYFTVVVARPYALALGRQDRPATGPGALAIAGPLVCSLIVVVTSAILLRALAVDTVGAAIAFGLLVGIGYLVAQTANIAINPNFPRPLLYTLVNAPYFVVCTVLASVILTVWR